jgi:hypothetical protein
MKLRFLLQPSMAALLGIRDGRKDAASGRAPDFMRTVRNRAERGALLRDGLNTTARIILLGLAMDAIYQVVVLRTFYPFEALLVALLLAFLPYAVIRGLVVRLQHRRKYKDAA